MPRRKRDTNRHLLSDVLKNNNNKKPKEAATMVLVEASPASIIVPSSSSSSSSSAPATVAENEGLLVHIINYVGTENDIINATEVSKKFHHVCHLNAIEPKIIPTFEIKPSEEKDDVVSSLITTTSTSNSASSTSSSSRHRHRPSATDSPSSSRIQSFFSTLNRYLSNTTMKKKLQRYTRIVFTNWNELYDCNNNKHSSPTVIDLISEIGNSQMNWITSLDLSLPPQSTPAPTVSSTAPQHDVDDDSSSSSSSNINSSSSMAVVPESLPYVLAWNFLPNLKDINLSNTGFSSLVLSNFCYKCSQLERITWNNNNQNHHDCDTSFLDMNGYDMKASHGLKELYMDHSVFYCSERQFQRYTTINLKQERETNANSNNNSNNSGHGFLFSYSSKKLERVSIRNAKYTNITTNVVSSSTNHVENNDNEIATGTIITNQIPQEALIKFVRNVPSLRWFRSNLSKENIAMLKKERPNEIQLIN